MANWFTSSQLSVEWLNKTVGQGSFYSPQLVDPKKGFHFMSGLENDPPALFFLCMCFFCEDSVETFAEAN